MLTFIIIVFLCIIFKKKCSAQTLVATDLSATCFRDEECGSSGFCKSVVSKSNICAPFVGLGDDCRSASCGKGLFCDSSAIVTSTVLICQELLPRNATCSLGSEPRENCQSPFRCSPKTLTCQPFEAGSEGDSCFFTSDCVDGLRCDQRKCIPVTPDFSVCTSFEQCTGTCIFRLNDAICVPSPAVGERCNSIVRNCLPTEDGQRVICNIPKGIDGRCVRASSLITTLGTECDQALDTCDAARGLSCRYSSSKGRTVCQQQVSQLDLEAMTFCDPNNEFSQCLPASGEPMDCLDRLPEQSVGSQLFYTCLPRQVNVGVGDICDGVQAVCPDGTECTALPFVSTFTRYCLRILREDDTCGDPFGGVCASSLTCRDGTCVQEEENFKTPITMVGLDGPCQEDLPCAPGSVCRESESGRSCQLPVMTVGRMEECFSLPTVDKQCQEGLLCRGDFNGLGIFRCRDPAGVGEKCISDAQCAKGLKCATENFLDTRCYDPKNSLNIGDVCGRKRDLPCGEADGELLKCLPQKGSSVPKCQKFRELYAGCNPEMNIGCLSSSICESKVCLPE